MILSSDDDVEQQAHEQCRGKLLWRPKQAWVSTKVQADKGAEQWRQAQYRWTDFDFYLMSQQKKE